MDENLEETPPVVVEARFNRSVLARVAKTTLKIAVIGAVGGIVGAKLAQSNDNES